MGKKREFPAGLIAIFACNPIIVVFMKKIFSLMLVLLLSLTAVFAAGPLKIMSYNVRNAKGMDNAVDFGRVAKVILEAAPDVVAVEELDSMTVRYGKKYVLGEIASRVNMHPTYFPAIEFGGGKYGIGVLSKEKPLSFKGYSLPGREEQRALLVAEFEDYLFACTHLSLTEEDRMASLEIIKKIAGESTKPLFLAGDMNDLPGSPFIKGLQKDFHLLNNIAEMTFPAPLPDRTLDYIALLKKGAPDYKVLKAEVIAEPMASDHRPVMVELEIQEEKGEVFTGVFDGLERSYKFYAPEGLQQGAPLVFVLHGYGARIEHVDDKGFSEAAEKYGFAVCYPQGAKDGRGNPCWNVGYPFQENMEVDDVSFLCKLAEQLQKEYGLSAENTFCTGMSNGGEMCYLMAYCGQETFKAVAPIAGLTMEWMPQEYKRTRKIPLFEIHGTNDKVSEWTGDLQNKGGWGAYIAVPDAVEYWVRRNGCRNEVVENLPLKGDGAHQVIAHRFVGKKNAPQVWLYEVVDGVHSWFNEDMDTAGEIWKFFSMYLVSSR